MSRIARSHFTGCWFCLLTLSLAWPAPARAAQEHQPPTPSETRLAAAPAQAPVDDRQINQTISLPMLDGQVDGQALFSAVARDLHWIAEAVDRLLPPTDPAWADPAWPDPIRGLVAADSEGRFGPAFQSSRSLTRPQVDQLIRLFPEVFSIDSDPVTAQRTLLIDRQALVTLLTDKKRQLRGQVAQWTGIQMSALLLVDSTWPSAAGREAEVGPGGSVTPPASRSPAATRIVVLLHGMHSTTATSEAMALDLHRKTGLPMAIFVYPNDAPVAESAEWLVRQLGALQRQYPEHAVSLVGYSLGGLVARAALELPTERDSASLALVDQVIMVFPPNGGTGLAQYAPLLEAGELWQRGRENGLLTAPVRRLLGAVVDGFNEASADLDPDSPLLQELNDQPRAAEVSYTILAGNAGFMRPRAALLMNIAARQLLRASDHGPLATRFSQLVALPELQHGRGDGVVHLESARLDGVGDFEVLPLGHMTWSEVDSPGRKQLVDAIVNRLRTAESERQILPKERP